MDAGFSLYEEAWRDSLDQFVRAIDSSAFEGDAPRQRMRSELVRTLTQSKAVLSASAEVRATMELVQESMEEASRNARDKKVKIRR